MFIFSVLRFGFNRVAFVRLLVCGRLIVAEINPAGFCTLKVFSSDMSSECTVNLPVFEYKGIV